mmetsp:Transcript_40147/g.119157  ORF Transcript_40147/g.119157 Transcript_40147/m.119157 type:complete len:425 (+) Transcript_40147:483-1757(+)
MRPISSCARARKGARWSPMKAPRSARSATAAAATASTASTHARASGSSAGACHAAMVEATYFIRFVTLPSSSAPLSACCLSHAASNLSASSSRAFAEWATSASIAFCISPSSPNAHSKSPPRSRSCTASQKARLATLPTCVARSSARTCAISPARRSASRASASASAPPSRRIISSVSSADADSDGTAAPASFGTRGAACSARRATSESTRQPTTFGLSTASHAAWKRRARRRSSGKSSASPVLSAARSRLWNRFASRAIDLSSLESQKRRAASRAVYTRPSRSRPARGSHPTSSSQARAVSMVSGRRIHAWIRCASASSSAAAHSDSTSERSRSEALRPSGEAGAPPSEGAGWEEGAAAWAGPAVPRHIGGTSGARCFSSARASARRAAAASSLASRLHLVALCVCRACSRVAAATAMARLTR